MSCKCCLYSCRTCYWSRYRDASNYSPATVVTLPCTLELFLFPLFFIVATPPPPPAVFSPAFTQFFRLTFIFLSSEAPGHHWWWGWVKTLPSGLRRLQGRLSPGGEMAFLCAVFQVWPFLTERQKQNPGLQCVDLGGFYLLVLRAHTWAAPFLLDALPCGSRSSSRNTS